MARKKDKQKRKRLRGGSTLQEHKQVRKTLLPPLAQLGVQLSSWAKNMLPEMLWADCLLTHYEFNQAGGCFTGRSILLTSSCLVVPRRS